MWFAGRMTDQKHSTTPGLTARPARADSILVIMGTVAIVVGIALLPEAPLAVQSGVLIAVGVAAVIVGLVLRRRRPPEQHRPLDPHPGVDNPAIIVHHDYGEFGAGAGGDGGGGGGGGGGDGGD